MPAFAHVGERLEVQASPGLGGIAVVPEAEVLHRAERQRGVEVAVFGGQLIKARRHRREAGMVDGIAPRVDHGHLAAQ